MVDLLEGRVEPDVEDAPRRLSPAARSWLRAGVLLVSAAAVVAAIVALVVPPSITDPSGVTGEVLGAFELDGPLDAHLDGPYDVQFETVTLAPGTSPGWHAHGGYTFTSITSGGATLYDSDDPTCSPKLYFPGDGFTESPMHIHIVRNEGPKPLILHIVTLTPKGAKASIVEPRSKYCDF